MRCVFISRKGWGTRPNFTDQCAPPNENRHILPIKSQTIFLNTPKESLACQFLIDTLPIKNASNSIPVNKCAHSNRHSSESYFEVCYSTPSHLFSSTSTSSSSSTSSTSSASSTSFPSQLHFANQTTGRQYLCAHSNLLCYSFPVTRVPPNGLRASAPARSHGCGVDVSLPRNVPTTGAFPHKFTYSTGLMGSMNFFASKEAELQDLWLRGAVNSSGSVRFGLREPLVGNTGVKEKSCES